MKSDYSEVIVACMFFIAAGVIMIGAWCIARLTS